MSTAAAVATQKRAPHAPYYVDPFGMTQKLLRDEFSPALPKGVAKAWTVAAYTSGAAFAEDANSIPPGPDLRLMAKIRQRFLTPVGPDPEQNLLRQAVALARTEEFRRKRADFYAWEESIIEENRQTLPLRPPYF